MDEVLQIVTLGRAARNAASLKNRQPLARPFMPRRTRVLAELFSEIIEEELNVKELVFLSGRMSQFTDLHLQAPAEAAWARSCGKQLNEVRHGAGRSWTAASRQEGAG